MYKAQLNMVNKLKKIQSFFVGINEGRGKLSEYPPLQNPHQQGVHFVSTFEPQINVTN